MLKYQQFQNIKIDATELKILKRLYINTNNNKKEYVIGSTQ